MKSYERMLHWWKVLVALTRMTSGFKRLLRAQLEKLCVDEIIQIDY